MEKPFYCDPLSIGRGWSVGMAARIYRYAFLLFFYIQNRIKKVRSIDKENITEWVSQNSPFGSGMLSLLIYKLCLKNQ